MKKFSESSGETGHALTHQAKYLFPSELFVTTEPAYVQTILGSCVAVCLFDPQRRIAGINHFMVPYWNGQGLASPKFGNISTDMLIKRMVDAGANLRDITAKVFGGAMQFEQNNNIINVGVRNIQVAENVLIAHGIPVSSGSTGGENGRKIVFDTVTGAVMMKFIIRKKT
jgi:chemotaxis protein CheD